MAEKVVWSDHVIDRYHVVGVRAEARSITCSCGWHGHEDLYARHRKSAGVKSDTRYRSETAIEFKHPVRTEWVREGLGHGNHDER